MSRTVSFISLGLLCLVWGSTWPIIKIGLEAVPPFLAAGVRFLIAGIVLFGLSWLQGVRLPKTFRAHFGLLCIGVGIGLSYGAVYWGQQYIPAGLSAVLFATNPLFVMLLAHVAVDSEAITWRKFVGVLLGFFGVVFIFQDDLQLPNRLNVIGAAVTLISPFVVSLSNVGIKKWGYHFHPYNLTALPMTYAAALLLVVSFWSENVTHVSWTPAAVSSVLYLSIVGSVFGFVIFYSLLKKFPVSTLSFASYVFPVVALALGYVLLGETLEMQTLVGGATILVGIIVATRGGNSSYQQTLGND